MIPEQNNGGNTGHAWFFPTNMDRTGFDSRKGRVGWFAIGY